MDLSIYTLAEEFAQQTHRSVFITGKAGSGKTTFLRQLRQSTNKQIAIVAPTGVAAINAGGVTIHSFFQLPFTPFVPTAEGRQNLIGKMKMSGPKRKVLQELELLVIDEISMVRADVMDEIDTVLRHYRFRHNEPFGGVQLICIGDLYQLAPVAMSEEWRVLSPYYKTPYFFDSLVIQAYPLLCLEFDKIFRQKDKSFIDLLNAIRDNKLTNSDLKLIEKRYCSDFNLSKQPDYILLTTHNAKADRINAEEMDRLKTCEHSFTATIDGEFPEKNFPNNPILILKVGAKVMFIANDSENPRRYYNGKIGTIARIDGEGNVYVHCSDDDEDIKVKKEIWTNIRYSVNPTTKQIEEEELGSYTQLPLRLAWAITIHKSQGLTFDKVAIDIEDAFTSGQVYVALSRCRSLEGILLLSSINRNSLSVNPDVIQYSAVKPDLEELRTNLDKDKSIYNLEILQEVFNFNFCLGQVNELRVLIGNETDLFNKESQNFVEEVHQLTSNVTMVGSKFRKQLTALFQQDDDKKIDERIKAASQYFTEEIDKLKELLKHSPTTSESYEMAEEYNFCLRALYDEISRKRLIIYGIRNDFSVKKINKLKASFKADKLKTSTYIPIYKRESAKETKRKKKKK